MFLVQSVRNEKGEWQVVKKDHYTMTINKLCKRLSERSGLTGSHTAALRKHGSIIIPRSDQSLKLEIQLEGHDGKLTGETVDFTDPDGKYSSSPGYQVHPGRGGGVTLKRPRGDDPDSGRVD